MRRVILFIFSVRAVVCVCGGGRYTARLFLLFSFPCCSADHEQRDWLPCKVPGSFFRVGNQYAECDKQLTGGCSEGLGVFWFFFKQQQKQADGVFSTLWPRAGFFYIISLLCENSTNQSIKINQSITLMFVLFQTSHGRRILSWKLLEFCHPSRIFITPSSNHISLA